MSELQRLQRGLKMAVDKGDRGKAEELVGLIEEMKASQTKEAPTYGEGALTVLSGAVAEPLAGLMGISKGMNVHEPPGAGARAVEETRESLTYQPRTESGKAGLESIAHAASPITEGFAAAENYLGDTVMEETGSPVLATIAKSFPTFAAEVLTLGVGSKTVKGTKAASKAVNEARKKARFETDLLDTLSESSPSIEQLKSASDALYKEIDSLGVRVDATEFDRLAQSIGDRVVKEGLDVDLTPKSQAVVNRIFEKVGEDISVTELDTLRKKASGAMGGDPADARLAGMIVDSIDDFLDKPKGFKTPPNVEIGPRYKAARDMWGRARRSELLEDAFEKARNQASGFENGIVIQFRQLLNNKRTKKLFKGEELAAMQRVVRGDVKTNIAKFIGRMGLFEGKSTSLLGAAVGSGAGFMIGGPVGAIAFPLIGQVSRNLAQRLTAKHASMANDIIRAGKDGKKITAAYIRHTPKAQRNPKELAQLLQRGDVDLETIKVPLGREAADLVAAARNQ